ncbi:HNH endonuclease [Nocardia amamiensis]|uniref:HNH endonuclease n=1 Tax=Nocardia amamiensis TaxID=404578 RepID=UPI0035A253A1
MFTGCIDCAGSWRPRCSRPWQPSTARRCRRWRPSTKPRSRHHTGHAPASKRASNDKAGNHWSHGSAAYRCIGRKTAKVRDSPPVRVDYPHKEILTRLLADTCELCGTVGEVEVHHIRKLAELGIPGRRQPQWITAMANRRRKTLVVCTICHGHIHTGHPAAPLTQ